MQYLPRNVAVYYIKLQSLTGKIQQTAGSIGFVQKSLHHKVVPTFAKLKGECLDINGKLRAKQVISKSHLIEYKKKLATLCLSYDELSNIVQSNYGRIFQKLCYKYYLYFTQG